MHSLHTNHFITFMHPVTPVESTPTIFSHPNFPTVQDSQPLRKQHNPVFGVVVGSVAQGLRALSQLQR